jgi:hypothetical protein
MVQMYIEGQTSWKLHVSLGVIFMMLAVLTGGTMLVYHALSVSVLSGSLSLIPNSTFLVLSGNIGLWILFGVMEFIITWKMPDRVEPEPRRVLVPNAVPMA